MVKGRGSQMIGIRLTDTEVDTIRKLAIERKNTISGIIRQALRNYRIEVRTDDVRELEQRLDAVVRVQQKILGDLDEMRNNILSVAEYYRHIIWNVEDKPRIVLIDGKKVKSYPMYWVKAIKREEN